MLQPNTASSFCEFKGKAQYHDIVVADKKAIKAAWQYPDASGAYEPIREYVAVYAHLMDACFVDKEEVMS